MNIGVIGAGKLGICMALVLEEVGYNVFCSDVNKDIMKSIGSKKINTQEPFVKEMLAQAQNIFVCDTNVELISMCDVIFVITATPSLENGEYDVSSIRQVIDDFDYSGMCANKIMVVVCTTNPGDCEEFQKELSTRGVQVVYIPEFIAQGSIIRNIKESENIIIGGSNPHALDVVSGIYKKLHPKVQDHIFMSSKSAEICKIAINCYLTTKITFANMIGQVLYKSDLESDTPKVLAAMGKDSRIGQKYLNFGFGFGGPCFPRDNLAFSKYMEKIGIVNNFGLTTDLFNKDHLEFMYRFHTNKNFGNLPFFFKYVSYKKDVDIFTESQQLELCIKLLQNGYEVIILKSESTEEVVKKIVSEMKIQSPIFVDSEEDIKEKYYIIN